MVDRHFVCLFVNRENCEKEAAKVFRQYYRRPYFLPPMTEATEGNWFIVSKAENKTLSVSFSRSSKCKNISRSFRPKSNVNLRN